MRAKTGSVMAGAAIVAIALWIWFSAAHSRREAEARREALAARQQELLAEAGRLEATIVAAELAQKSVAAATARPTSPANLPPAANLPVNEGAAPAEPRRPTTAANLAASDPNLRLLEPRYQRAIFNQTYGEFFAVHGLSEEQIERFMAAKMKRMERRAELGALARTQDADGRKAIVAQQRQADADHDLEIERLLGAEANRDLDEYERSFGVRRDLVNAFAGTATLAGVPLTAAQGDRLLQAALAAGFAPTTVGGVPERPRVDIGLLDAQAQGILTPEQFQLFLRTSQVRKSEEAQAALAIAQQLDAQRTQTAEGK